MGYYKTIKNQISEFKRYTFLLSLLVKRNIKNKYRGSALGVVWSLLEPLLMMIVLTIIFSTIFKRSIDNFPLYLITGRLMFTFFSTSTTQAMKSIFSSSQLLRKVYIPKYIITLAAVLSAFIIFLISMIDLIIVMIITRASFTIYLLYIPFYLGLFFIFSLGWGLVLATITTFFRDIEHLYGVFTMVLMYFSAIFYPVEIIPEKYQFLMALNPLHHYISGMRQIIYYGASPDLSNLLMCLVIATVSLAFGLTMFRKNQERFMLFI